ncbi:MAG TPA: HAMP domain-containing sensor histidine kinase [Chloroflexia bacterium]|nr:HAMP domain-containing sensor histidine kinase [Chloroflexia bacterium]
MSLRLRLALWYGALTGLVVLVVSIFTYAAHTRGHYDDADHSLHTNTDHIIDEYVAQITGPDRGAAVSLPVSNSIPLRIYDAEGRVLIESPLAASLPPLNPRDVLDGPPQLPFDPVAGVSPPMMPMERAEGKFGLMTDASGTRWRLYVVPMSRVDQYLLTAASLARIDASVAAFRQLVVFLALSGAAVAFGAGWLLARSALRPVIAMTETAGAIAHSRGLDQRVPAPARGDELGQLAGTFNEMLDSLEGAYRAQQRFVADASHELRAPLTAIQGNLELLERQTNMPPEERKEAVSEAKHEAHRLARLVADLLALARADAGVPMRREPVELDRVLIDSVADAQHLTRGHKLNVAHLEPAVVHGDPDRLKQLILILLDNAIKYTPQNGRVEASLQKDGQGVEIAIRDTGIGIPQEDLPRVFDRFYRADPARTRDPGGTGLGLSIARWIAEQHGGAITLTSRPGQGTTASAYLPLNGMPLPPGEPEPAARH